MPSSAVEPAGPALGPRLTGLDLAMLGDDAWDDAFMTLMFEFERPVPELEGVLRAWLLRQLDDPSNLLRLRIAKGPDGKWRYFASDEPSDALCARMLTASAAPLDVDEMPAKLRAPNADAAWARVAPDGFLFSINHVFVDGVNLWRLMDGLFLNAAIPSLPRTGYRRGLTELCSLGALASVARAGVPRTPLRVGDEPERAYPSLDVATLRALRRRLGKQAPFLAGLAGVVCASVWRELDAAPEPKPPCPNVLNVGVIAAFDVPGSKHFNDFGVVPLAVRRPPRGGALADDALAIARQAAPQLRARAPIAVLSWSRANVHNSTKGFFTLDVALSCAPAVADFRDPLALRLDGGAPGGAAARAPPGAEPAGAPAAPADDAGRVAKLRKLRAHLYTWTPVFCAAVSYDSKMDASLLVRAADVKAHALVERMHACMTEVKVANELFAASAVEGGARGADNRRVSNLGLQDHQPSRKKEG